MVSVVKSQLFKSSRNVVTVFLPLMYATSASGRFHDVVPLKTPNLFGVDPIPYKKSESETLKNQYNKLYLDEHFLKDIRSRWPEVTKTANQLPIMQNPRELPALPKQNIDEPWRRPYPKHYPPW